MIDASARARAFRASILREAAQGMAQLMASQRRTRIVDIPLIVGTRGVVLAVNDHVFFRLGLNGLVTVLTWSLAGTVAGASASGTIRIDVRVGATLAAAASICGGTGNQPQLTAQAERADQTPTGWTTQIADSQWLEAIVASTGGTLEVAGLTLRCAVDTR
jgi:hypothetical protein